MLLCDSYTLLKYSSTSPHSNAHISHFCLCSFFNDRIRYCYFSGLTFSVRTHLVSILRHRTEDPLRFPLLLALIDMQLSNTNPQFQINVHMHMQQYNSNRTNRLIPSHTNKPTFHRLLHLKSSRPLLSSLALTPPHLLPTHQAKGQTPLISTLPVTASIYTTGRL